MRVFSNIDLALSEIERDISKQAKMEVTRVQQWDDVELFAQEAIGYTYAISPGGIPEKISDIVSLGIEHEMGPYIQDPDAMTAWLKTERNIRLDPLGVNNFTPAETIHPALRETAEGKHWSYVYRERLIGMVTTIVETLFRNEDSRRAYWPIFHPGDSHRAMSPTRIPCSLGYHFMIRTLGDGNKVLYMKYDQRSADFDNFFLSDIWLANQVQLHVLALLQKSMNVGLGPFIHTINSFHSFKISGKEVY